MHFHFIERIFGLERWHFTFWFPLIWAVSWENLLFIPGHFKKCKVLCYTRRSKICVWMSVCQFIHPSICPSAVGLSVRQSIHPSALCFCSLSWTIFDRFSSNFVQELKLGRSGLWLQMGKFRQISTELWPLIDVKHLFLLSLAYFDWFSSNFAWELMLGRSF